MSVTGVAPCATLNSRSVSGETIVCDGGLRKPSMLSASRMPRKLRLTRQRQRVDPDQMQGRVANPNHSLQDRRHLPARQPQLDVEVLREERAARRHQALRATSSEYGGCAIITSAGLLIERLNAAPKRRRDCKANEQRGQIRRVSAPMAHER